MIFNKVTAFILLIFITSGSLAQKKSLTAVQNTGKIVIDGKIDENEWNTANTATGFTMYEPDNGKPADYTRRTEVKVLYDNDAVYFAAVLYDDPANILKEIALRDNFQTADHFGVFINGYNDGQQDFQFFVSAAGTQMDCVTTRSGEDYSWDAIWYSEVRITEYGWVVEMKIPYAALRFSDGPEQIWGLNFYRDVRKDRQKYTWNPVDRNIGSFIVQTGELTGIQNIEPPTRLFFIPYTSFYVSDTPKGTETELKGGMDIKYGINDAFTLDAILVPDFGQTAFDNVVLNLGPFEQQFNENRPFFTEGTDIFNKGGLVYTRRIGGPPTGDITVGDNEEVTGVPSAVNLLNAIKISGRTSKGLGIGVMNAITEKTYATVTNTETGETRRAIAEPLVNYNVFVLDQRFRGNSSVAVANTNVVRDGSFKDANVIALVADLNTKANTYNLSLDYTYSYINDLIDRKGFTSTVSASKTAGKYRYGGTGYYASKDFEMNDLGIMFTTNLHSVNVFANYRILNPTKNYNSFQVNTIAYSEFHNETGKLQNGYLNVNVNSTTRKNDYIGYGFDLKPFKSYDFYEPRISGRFVEVPESVYAFIYLSSNYNRKFAIDIEPEIWLSTEKDRNYYGLAISPRYRFNDRLQLIYSFNYGLDTNNKGWTGFEEEDIIFTRRDRTTITNKLSGKYAVNNKMTLNLTARHYYTYGENLEFLTLGEDGTLGENSTFNENRDFTYNNWNFDLSYTWWFAPGSQLSVLYRNNAATSMEHVSRNYGRNFENLFRDNLSSIFSVSLRYYIDYNAARNWI